ncbi:MAG: dienelactone hydrolase family protein [Deltaproteobacteria bacterium]|nr:dienelactone hydrolase family protein [Deltaproteobacteria bacterium]
MNGTTKRGWIVAITLILAAAGCGFSDDDDSTDSTTPDDDSGDDDTADDDDASGDEDMWAPLPDDDAADVPSDYPEPYDPAARGPYQVGVRTYVFVDDSRWQDSPAGGRRVLTEVWYPAFDSAADWPRDIPRTFFNGWDDVIFSVFKAIGVPQTEIDNFDAPRDVARDAPLYPWGGPIPLVLLSHGFAGVRFQDFTLCEYLASHGYIVVAPDHTKNAFVTAFPEGPVIFNPLATPWSYAHRLKDLSFLIDVFTDLNAADPEAFWNGRIDLARVGAIGHSFGGTTVLQETKRDGRIGAAVDMASFMFPFLPDGFDTPLMFMIGAEDHSMGDTEPLIRVNFAQSPAPKYFLEFYDGGHYTFTDACILSPTLFGEGDGCGYERRGDTNEPFHFIEHDLAFEIINGYITAFFGLHLKGQDGMRAFLGENHYPDEIDYAFFE